MAIIFVLSYQFSIAQINSNTSEKARNFSFNLDEDLKPLLLFSKENDQNYTMGLGVSWSTPRYDSSKIFEPNKWLARLIIGEKLVNYKDEGYPFG